MINHLNRRLRSGREGFTLIEVLLTLSIMVMIAGLAWPGLSGSFASRRLRAAADQVRAQWVSMRVDAMKTDCAQMFRFAPSGRDYRIDSIPVLETVVDPNTGVPTGSVTLGPQYNGEPLLQELLPDGITFLALDNDIDVRSSTIALPTDTVGPTTGDSSWSIPLLFYPDGTATTIYRLTLQNDRGMAINLSLRGLTGVVKVSGLYPVEQRSP